MRRPPGLAILVHAVDTLGGMQRQALTLGEALARRGARVTVVSSFLVSGRVPRFPRGRRPVERRAGITVHWVPLPERWSWDSALAFYELAATLLLGARLSRLDALYAVQWTAGVSAVKIGRVLGRAVLVKPAGGGVNGDFAVLGREPWGERTLALLRQAERVVCISPQIAAEARAAGFRDEQVLSIPNGVDLARFPAPADIADSPRPADLAGPPAALPGPETILFVGALRREKRLPELVRAFALVARERPHARLVLAGEGPEAEAVRAHAREHGLAGKVELLGARDDVPDLLRAASVFVLTSESEGLSNALLEALAAGTPVVATDIEGNRAVVSHEREALLVSVGDAPALAKALGRLLEDRALARRLAAAGRERARAYSFEGVVARYESVLAELRRPAPSSLELVRRYLFELDNPGVLGLTRRALAQTDAELRPYLDRTTIATKRLLGLASSVERESTL